MRTGFGAAEFDASGRYLEVDLPAAGGTVTVGSLYLPSGEVGTERQDEKFRFMAAFLDHLTALRARGRRGRPHALVCGDWNIAHQEADLKNWRANQKSAGFLPEERAWLTRVLDWTPGRTWSATCTRTSAGPYSWWSYRGRAFDNDTRLAHRLPGRHRRASPRPPSPAVVERAASHDLRWSDHAPVTVVYDL